MPLIKRYFIWSNSGEAALVAVSLTLMGCSIQLAMGVMALAETDAISKVLVSAFTAGSLILTVIDSLLIVWSIVFLVSINKGIENGIVYIPFCSILAARLFCEFLLASYLCRWYLFHGVTTVITVMKALVYMFRTIMWLYCLLCVISRYQELKENEREAKSVDLSNCNTSVQEGNLHDTYHVTSDKQHFLDDDVSLSRSTRFI